MRRKRFCNFLTWVGNSWRKWHYCLHNWNKNYTSNFLRLVDSIWRTAPLCIMRTKVTNIHTVSGAHMWRWTLLWRRKLIQPSVSSCPFAVQKKIVACCKQLQMHFRSVALNKNLWFSFSIIKNKVCRSFIHADSLMTQWRHPVM